MMAASLALLPNLQIDPAPFTGPAGTLPAVEIPIANQSDLRRFILGAVHGSLPRADRGHALKIARAVIVEGKRQNLDPFFLLAVIQTESAFHGDVVGQHGEIGLMQILPSTADWIAPRLGLSANYDLHDPAINIKIGAAYFATLRRTFRGRTDRFVGAYNMGVANVRRLITLNAEPRIYPAKVLGHYRAYYSLLNGNPPTTLAN